MPTKLMLFVIMIMIIIMTLIIRLSNSMIMPGLC